MSLQVHDSSARAVAVGSLITSISITPAPANSYLFTDGGCTSPLTTVSLGAGQTTLNFYVKIPFADANANISLTASDGTLGNGTITMTPTSPGAVQNLNFWMGSNEPVGNCNSGKVVSTDSMSNPSPVAANTTVNLSASNGTLFYSSGTCTGTTSTVTITGGQAEAIFYWRRYNAGADTVTATDATTSLTAANTGVNYTTGGATQIIFVLPGQNYNGGAATYAAAVTGTPNTFVYNTSSPPITAYLVDNYFNLITAASGSCSVINTSDTFDTNPSSVPFTSGAANFNLSAASSPGTSYTIQGAGSSCSYSVVDSAPYDRP